MSRPRRANPEKLRAIAENVSPTTVQTYLILMRCQLAIAGLLRQGACLRGDLGQTFGTHILDNGCQKASGSSDSNTDVSLVMSIAKECVITAIPDAG